MLPPPAAAAQFGDQGARISFVIASRFRVGCLLRRRTECQEAASARADAVAATFMRRICMARS